MFHAFDVSFARGRRQVIADMNLELRTGELTVVIGPNGAGKSTLLKLLTGDLKPSGGAIWFDGRSLQQWNARELAGRRAVLLQSASVVFPFTVHEVISLGLPEGIYAQDKRAFIQEMLRVFDLNGFESRLYQELSGGEQQRVIWRAWCASSSQARRISRNSCSSMSRFLIWISSIRSMCCRRCASCFHPNWGPLLFCMI